jgi:hypothetical protein
MPVSLSASLSVPVYVYLCPYVSDNCGKIPPINVRPHKNPWSRIDLSATAHFDMLMGPKSFRNFTFFQTCQTVDILPKQPMTVVL